MSARFFARVAAIGSFVFAAVPLANQATSASHEPARNNTVTAVVRTDLGELKWMRTKATDYTPLQRYGRHVFVRERCWLCHSESVRLETNETRRGGPVGEAGEFAYDVPHLANSARIGPDLKRVGLKYSDEWHFAHFWNPRQLSPDSIMEEFSHLFDTPAEAVKIVTDGQGDRTLEKTPVTQRLFDFASKEKIKLTPNTAGLLFVPLEAQGKFPIVWTPNQEYVGDTIKIAAETKDLEALVAYVQKLGANRGKWRDLFQPLQLEVTDETNWAAHGSRSIAGVPPLARSPEWISYGKEVYTRRCMGCHGTEGDGNGPAATFLYRQRPRNFTQGEFKFRLSKEPLPTAELFEALIGSASRGHGVWRLWKALRHDVPAAFETAGRRGIAAGDQPLAQVFKTVQAGKLCYARVWRGPLRDGATIDGVRVGGIHRFAGSETIRAPEAEAGELVALGRIDGIATGGFLGQGATDVDAHPFPPPPPSVYERAIATRDRKDDVKLSAALHKIVQDDPSLGVEHRLETGETVLLGQGEIHLNAAIERLSSVYNVSVAVSAPKIAYKETIKRHVLQHGRLKRQTGGHGQFADVKIEIEPRPRGEGFLFTDKIVGGSVPRNYIPAVGEAAEEAMQKGPLGYPVVDIGVTLLDGGFHAVDSSDMAFRTATRAAVGEGLAKAEPVLLEPIDHVLVSIPNAFTAAAQRLLTGRRGHILGYAERPGWPGWDDVEALVPAAELHDFIIELRSDSMGLGAYRHRFDHLAEVRR